MDRGTSRPVDEKSSTVKSGLLDKGSGPMDQGTSGPMDQGAPTVKSEHVDQGTGGLVDEEVPAVKSGHVDERTGGLVDQGTNGLMDREALVDKAEDMSDFLQYISDSSDEAYKPNESCSEDEEDDEEDYADENEDVDRPFVKKATKPKWRVHNATVNMRDANELESEKAREIGEEVAANEKEEEYQSEEFGSLKGSDNDEDEKRPANFNPRVAFGQVHLELGMLFPNLEVFKKSCERLHYCKWKDSVLGEK